MLLHHVPQGVARRGATVTCGRGRGRGSGRLDRLVDVEHLHFVDHSRAGGKQWRERGRRVAGRGRERGVVLAVREVPGILVVRGRDGGSRGRGRGLLRLQHPKACFGALLDRHAIVGRRGHVGRVQNGTREVVELDPNLHLGRSLFAGAHLDGDHLHRHTTGVLCRLGPRLVEHARGAQVEVVSRHQVLEHHQVASPYLGGLA